MTSNKYDILVIGGGHAGIEAASVAARMNCKTALLTMSRHTIGKPSCNPSIGGTAKGHLVKEIDALGGVMGLLADRAGLQFKLLNKSKGPAVWSPRCQIDKNLYPLYAYHELFKTPLLDILEVKVNEILFENDKILGVRTSNNEILKAKCVILAAGTFLNGIMHTGANKTYGGRFGEPPSDFLSDLLKKYGFDVGRLKTGTPPRIDKRSINFNEVEISYGDEEPEPFSYKTKLVKNRMVCYGTKTNEKTHEYLKEGFDLSPMFTGRIQGVGPRYCPSIEDKVNRFSDRDSHKILLEPEDLFGNSVYVNGFSTSLPAETQEKALRSIPGLSNVQVLRWGYAIEYDFFFPCQLKFTLETKKVNGLFFAGQINGTSGYEEAAAQGLIAGINAALKIKEKTEFKLKRSEAYIGVLIDDLVNKSTEEPYRIFTSLAEYRLLLRQDNARERLKKYGLNLGLTNDFDYELLQKESQIMRNTLNFCKSTKLKADEINGYLTEMGENPINDSSDISTLAKRENLDLMKLLEFNGSDNIELKILKKNKQLISKLETEIKYEGYIARQLKEIDYLNENEEKIIPSTLDYDGIVSLSNEAREKLKKIQPSSLGQASRISGVSASDISILSVYLKG